MGLFSRKKPERSTRSTSRTATSSEAQAAELRGRARRRLIGALVLVLAAVIVVPMMFDDTPSQQSDTPVVLPAIVPPVPQPDLAVLTQPDYTVDEPFVAAGDGVLTPDQPIPDTGTHDATADAPAEPQQPAPETTPTAPVEAAPPVRKEPPQQQPAPPRPEPAARPSEPAPADNRTDDGSVALALLEGRAPGRSAAPAQEQGSFVLQIAAYSTEADAQSRRSNLVNAGVTNAYVERGLSNEKTTYRLRVGSFPTRDAAQAAQARLRALGYDNSLLLTQ